MSPTVTVVQPCESGWWSSGHRPAWKGEIQTLCDNPISCNDTEFSLLHSAILISGTDPSESCNQLLQPPYYRHWYLSCWVFSPKVHSLLKLNFYKQHWKVFLPWISAWCCKLCSWASRSLFSLDLCLVSVRLPYIHVAWTKSVWRRLFLKMPISLILIGL